MKATILNGARPGESQIDAVANTLVAHLTRQSFDVQAYTLRDHKIGYCIGCFGCWVKTPGECVIKDENRDIAADIIQSDLLIYVSPVVFGSYSSELKRMMDHLIPLVTPFFKRVDGEVHHQPRYNRYPSFMSIGLQRQTNPVQAALFKELSKRNGINFDRTPNAADVWPNDISSEEVNEQFQQLLNQIMEPVA